MTLEPLPLSPYKESRCVFGHSADRPRRLPFLIECGSRKRKSRFLVRKIMSALASVGRSTALWGTGPIELEA